MLYGEEFGTGEHAINNDGRKGYWVYVDNGGIPSESGGSSGKNYTLDEAKRIVAAMRKQGLNAYYTKGKTANRPLYNAFETSKPRIIRAAESKFGGT